MRFNVEPIESCMEMPPHPTSEAGCGYLTMQRWAQRQVGKEASVVAPCKQGTGGASWCLGAYCDAAGSGGQGLAGTTSWAHVVVRYSQCWNVGRESHGGDKVVDEPRGADMPA